MNGDLLRPEGGLAVALTRQRAVAPRALLMTLAVLLVCRGFDAKEQESQILGFLSGSFGQRFRCGSCESERLSPTFLLLALLQYHSRCHLKPPPCAHGVSSPFQSPGARRRWRDVTRCTNRQQVCEGTLYFVASRKGSRTHGKG